MKHPGYGAAIARMIGNFSYDALIKSEDVTDHLAKLFDLTTDKAKAIANVKLKRMADKGELKRLQKGLYCRVRNSPFGATVPNIDMLLIKGLTLAGGERIGYESGASLLNKLGITTLMPRDIELTTNRYETRLPEASHIRLRKPRTEITGENWKYLQFIDAAISLADAHADADDPEGLLLSYAKKQQLTPLTVIFTARRYYQPKTVLQLTDMLMEE